jgi:hypothetical protein
MHKIVGLFLSSEQQDEWSERAAIVEKYAK